MPDELQLVLLIGVLLGLLVASILIPMRWRRFFVVTRQDSVNERTVSTLGTVATAIGSLEDRMAVLEVQVARQAEVFSAISTFLKNDEPASTPSRAAISPTEATPRG